MLNQTQVIVHSIGQHSTTWWQSDQNLVRKVVGQRSWSWAWSPLLCSVCLWFSYWEGRLVLGTGLSLAVHCSAASAYGSVTEKEDWYWVLGFHWLFTVLQRLPMVQLLRREIGTGYWAFIGCSLFCSVCLWFSYWEGRLVLGTGLSLAVHCSAASAYGSVTEKEDWYWVLGFHWLFTVLQRLPMVQLLRRKIGTGYWAFIGCSLFCSVCLWFSYWEGRLVLGTGLSLAVHCSAASAYGPVIEKGDWYWAFIGCSLFCSFCLWSSYWEGRLVLGTGLSLAVHCSAASAYGVWFSYWEGRLVEWYSAFSGCSVSGSANFIWQNSTSLTWFYCSGTTNKVLESPPCLIGNTTDARYNTTEARAWTYMVIQSKLDIYITKAHTWTYIIILDY